MIVGMAGHIDHGKTSLVRALTGVDTDRLKEEKARGITIELGFAYIPLANGKVLGFVDVPGHERLVHTMIAGANSVDIALLVVAADDSIMPQTREHLEILNILGIHDGVVAITKADLADAERIAQIGLEIEELAASTSFKPLRILPVSSKTGEGIATLRKDLERYAQRHHEPASHDLGPFRFAIDRHFKKPGSGSIVTGSIYSGRVAVRDELIALPQNALARVRGLHVGNHPVDAADGGARAAINLVGRDIDTRMLRRGGWLLDPERAFQSSRFDIALRVLSDGAAIRGSLQPHLFHGAAHAMGRLTLLDADQLLPGQSGLAQIVIEVEWPVRIGDPIVVRDPSGRKTIGGGTVLDARPPFRRRRSGERIGLLSALRVVSTVEGALAERLAAVPYVVDMMAFCEDYEISESRGAALVADLKLIILSSSTKGILVIHPDAYARMATTIVKQIEKEYQTNCQTARGVSLQSVALSLEPRLPLGVVSCLIERMTSAGVVMRDGALVRPTTAFDLSPEDSRLWNRMADILDESPFKPPRSAEIAKRLGTTEINLRRACKTFCRTGRLVEAVKDMFFRPGAMAEMARVAADLSRETGGAFTAVQFRDRVGMGRMLAIDLLEYFDRKGLTFRKGDTRRVIKDPNLLFGPKKQA